MIERGYAPQFRCRPPCFNGVVQSLTLPRNALVLRQELCNLLEKGAIERIPASELESSFYSRYFVVAKRDGGLCSILDSTASQTLSEVCSRGHSVPVPCSSVWTGFGPRALSRSAWTQLSHPLRASGMRVLNYLDDWLILPQSRDTPASHIDKLLRHLEFLRLCVNMCKSILAPSQSNVSGSVLRLKAVEMRARPPVCLPCAFSNWTVYYTCACCSFG